MLNPINTSDISFMRQFGPHKQNSIFAIDHELNKLNKSLRLTYHGDKKTFTVMNSSQVDPSIIRDALARVTQNYKWKTLVSGETQENKKIVLIKDSSIAPSRHPERREPQQSRLDRLNGIVFSTSSNTSNAQLSQGGSLRTSDENEQSNHGAASSSSSRARPILLPSIVVVRSNGSVSIRGIISIRLVVNPHITTVIKNFLFLAAKTFLLSQGEIRLLTMALGLKQKATMLLEGAIEMQQLSRIALRIGSVALYQTCLKRVEEYEKKAQVALRAADQCKELAIIARGIAILRQISSLANRF